MTYEEAKVIIESMREETYFMSEFNALGVAKKAIETRIKYRLHDLRKNPDDLPPEVNKGYMVKVRDVEQPFSAYWSKMGIFVDEYGDRLAGIVAWKEIEPFEGVEDDD